MRIVRVPEFGAPSVLVVEDPERPSPGPGRLLVEGEVAGVVYGDTIVRAGRPRTHAVLPREQAAQARAALADRRTIGAILLKP
ncbi:MAG: hypothetical protein HOW97_26430 [Catenulispora sp.]|nr:hypothetical protein [Catenulispora sp.]